MAEIDKQSKDHELDRMLDAALAKYAAVEPRTGMEERVLANLRSADTPPRNGAWWSWGLATAAVVAVLLIVITFAWRWPTPSHPAVANRPAPTEDGSEPRIQGMHRDANAIAPRRRPAVRKTSTPAAAPKLDQFPAPHPLSEQEQILASYVAQFHDEAVMVARARMEEMRRDREQEMREAGSDGNEDSQVR